MKVIAPSIGRLVLTAALVGTVLAVARVQTQDDPQPEPLPAVVRAEIDKDPKRLVVFVRWDTSAPLPQGLLPLVAIDIGNGTQNLDPTREGIRDQSSPPSWWCYVGPDRAHGPGHGRATVNLF